MPKTTYEPEEIVAKLRQADVLIAQGHKIADVVRTIGVAGGASTAGFSLTK